MSAVDGGKNDKLCNMGRTMGRLAPKTKSLNRLFSFTGNQCAFPNCHDSLFFDDLFIGEIAHIHAVSPGGPRFLESLTNDQLRNHSNLIVLCHKHHRIVDNFVEQYPAEALLKMKKDHEEKFHDNPTILSVSKINSIQKQIETYWNDILDIVDVENKKHGMARPLNPNADIWQLLEIVELNIEKLSLVIDATNAEIDGHEPSKDNNLAPADWSMRVIGAGNFHGEGIHALLQLKVRIAEHFSLSNPDNKEAELRMLTYREELEVAAGNTVYFD